MWHKILTDIRKAPLWVWIGLAGTLVLVWFAYQQWRNGSGGIALQPIGGGGGTGGIGPGPAPLPPLPPDVFTSTGGTGSSGSSSSSTGTNGMDVAPIAIGEDVPVGAGYGTPINNPTADSQRAHRGLTSPPVGAGYGTLINNPLAAAQRAHRGLSTSNPGPQHRSPHEQPHPSLTFHRTNKTRGRVFD